MTRYTDRVKRLADHLRLANEKHQCVEPVTMLEPDLTTEEAYYIQLYNIERQLESGKTIVGKKIGLTSKAMQKSLGVDEPDYGHLLSDMVIEESTAVILADRVLQPRVEGELAFILKKDLKGPNITVEEVIEATEAITAAIEVVDSRIEDWNIRLEDTVADNASSAFYILGKESFKPEELDRIGVKMQLYKNGQLINEGDGSAVLGDSAYCVAWLANKLNEFDIQLKKGEVILAGALSTAIEAEKYDEFKCKFSEGLGEVTVRFAERNN